MRVLAALDGSVRAPSVFAAAMSFARLAHAHVVLFRAVPVPQEFPPAAATIGGDRLADHLTRVATAELGALARSAPDVPCEVVVKESLRPARAILDVANERNVDLIVIGSHGYDAVDRLLGTTAARVVNLSTRDVLVVHRS